MLAIFRNNQISTVVPLAFYVVLTHLPALLGYVTPATTSTDAGGVLYKAWLTNLATQPFWSAVSAIVLVVIQAVIINNLAVRFRLLNDRNWLPGLFYALAAACLPDFLFLSPPLVAVTCIPLALQRIFQAYKAPYATALVFDTSWWITLAALLYPPALFLLIAAYAGLYIMRSFYFREQLVFLTGLLVPLFLTWLWYFWTDRGGDFWHVQFDGLFGLYHVQLRFDTAHLLRMLAPVMLWCITVFSFGAYFHRKLIQTQKSVSTLYWFMAVGAVIIFLQPEPLPAHFLLIMPAIGIFMALSFFAIRNRFIAEIFHLALLGIILFAQFLPVVHR